MLSERTTPLWKPAEADIPRSRTPPIRRFYLPTKVEKSRLEFERYLDSLKKVEPKDEQAANNAHLTLSQVISFEIRSARIAAKKKIDPYFVGQAERPYTLQVKYDFLQPIPRNEQHAADSINAPPEEVKEEEYAQFSFANGDKYEGHYTIDLANGPRRCGIGKYSKPNGTLFLGQWFADKLHGDSCLMILPNERVIYKGGFRDGVFHGLGAYRGPNGYYEGPFFNGRYVGNGAYCDTEGFRYKGTFRCTDALNLELDYKIISDRNEEALAT